jgi:hypothetical protein
MGTKKKTEQAPQANSPSPKALEVPQQPSESTAEALARTALRPTVQAALTLMDYNKGFGELAINTLVTDLRQQCEMASKGDLNRAEALLTAQAHTLDAIFNHLARKALHADYLSQYETYLRLGLKAQSQCRATLETLAAIKNPRPVAFVQQANIAHGPQQVNNEAAQPSQASRARETEKQPNKLLEKRNDERLDTGAQGAASLTDPTLETVGAINRSKDGRG